MKQSEIKTECELISSQLKILHDRIKRLQSICKHKDQELVNCFIAGHPIPTCMVCNKQLFPDWQKLGEIKREDV